MEHSSGPQEGLGAVAQLHRPAVPFVFEDVDCKANRPIKTHCDLATSLSADELLSGGGAWRTDLDFEVVQSPLPVMKETAELLLKLVVMYVILEVAAGLVRHRSPVHQLFLAVAHLKLALQAMLAPLSMMCSGFVLAFVQYSLLLRKQRQVASSRPYAAATAVSHGKHKAQ